MSGPKCSTCQDLGWVHANQGITRPAGDCYSEGPDRCPACGNPERKPVPASLRSPQSLMRERQLLEALGADPTTDRSPWPEYDSLAGAQAYIDRFGILRSERGRRTKRED